MWHRAHSLLSRLSRPIFAHIVPKIGGQKLCDGSSSRLHTFITHDAKAGSQAPQILSQTLVDRNSGSGCRHLSETTSGHGPEPPRTTLDQDEARKFDFSSSWWDEHGHSAALHTLNRLRIPFIRDGLLQQCAESPPVVPEPLMGFQLLDIGCGGGLLSEALARLGATVTGVDALPENVELAASHASHDPQLASRITYRQVLVEDMVVTDYESFDGVVCSEVIEHVHDVDHFIACCSQLIKPGGSIYFTTMNRTYLSYALAVVAAEQVFGLVKPGSHDWNKFIPPGDLQEILGRHQLVTRVLHGMTLNPFTLQWCWVENTNVNYALHAVKADTGSEL